VAGSEWLGQTVENITGLVTGAQTRTTRPTLPPGRLGEADAALREGDIEAAIARVEAVAALPDGVDPAAAESWLTDAGRGSPRSTAQAQLDAHIRELLTATVN
jgi:hypothetical protein